MTLKGFSPEEERLMITQEADISGDEDNVRGHDFSPTGDEFYVGGFTNDEIFQFSLSSPWDVGTFGSATSFSVATELSGSPLNVVVSNGGSTMYVIDGGEQNIIKEYTLSTPFDISTASFSQDSQDFGNDIVGIDFGTGDVAGGTKMFAVRGFGGNVIEEFDLSTAFDTTTATLNESRSAGDIDLGPPSPSQDTGEDWVEFTVLDEEGRTAYLSQMSLQRSIIRRLRLSSAYSISSIEVDKNYIIHHQDVMESKTGASDPLGFCFLSAMAPIVREGGRHRDDIPALFTTISDQNVALVSRWENMKVP